MAGPVGHEVHQGLTAALVDIRDGPENDAYRMADRLVDENKFNREMIGIEAGVRAISFARLTRAISTPLHPMKTASTGGIPGVSKGSRTKWNRMT